MKSKYILTSLLITLLFQHCIAQITPIETITDSKKITYNTQSYNDMKENVENQSYDIKQKLLNSVKISDNIDAEFMKNCITTPTYSSLKSNKAIFIVRYIVSQNGSVLAASLVNYKKLSLSNNEVDCILTESMEHSFTLTNVPNTINHFKIKISKSYKFSN